MMKAKLGILLLVVAGGIVTLWAQQTKDDAPDRLQRLEDRIAGLEQKVQTLEAQLKALAGMRREGPGLDVPGTSRLPFGSHPEWKPFEFNGETYFIVPLKPGTEEKE